MIVVAEQSSMKLALLLQIINCAPAKVASFGVKSKLAGPVITLHMTHLCMTTNTPFLACSLPQSCSLDATAVLVSYGNRFSKFLTLHVVLNDIWRLAATLGARSSFKRLPKRDVMSADIIQLCGLITEPAEPLALRLSSNLMVGVARYVSHAYVTRPGK